MRPILLPLVSLFGLLVAGCPTPTQYGGPIAVDTDGFAARMAWLCHWGVHGGQDQACFDPNAKEKEAAGRDHADAGAAGKAKSADDRPKTEVIAKPPEKAVAADAGAQKDKETPEAGAATTPSSAPEAGAEPKPDDNTGPEEPPSPPDSPGEEKSPGK